VTVPTTSLAEVTSRAFEILARELGVANALRFINQFTNGSGDYTAERDALSGPTNLDQLIAEIGGSITQAEARPPEE
jgi:hypothetical protein